MDVIIWYRHCFRLAWVAVKRALILFRRYGISQRSKHCKDLQHVVLLISSSVFSFNSLSHLMRMADGWYFCWTCRRKLFEFFWMVFVGRSFRGVRLVCAWRLCTSYEESSESDGDSVIRWFADMFSFRCETVNFKSRGTRCLVWDVDPRTKPLYKLGMNAMGLQILSYLSRRGSGISLLSTLGVILIDMDCPV